jgi:hypothetical protein
MSSYVPVIYLKMDGIPVDLIFVALRLTSIPTDIDVLEDHYLRDLDEASVGSYYSPEKRLLGPNTDLRTCSDCCRHVVSTESVSRNASSSSCLTKIGFERHL